MTSSPLFSKAEADRILKRAAEIEGSGTADPLTVAELRSIAGEAGFGAAAVDRAIAEARRAGIMTIGFLGGFGRFVAWFLTGPEDAAAVIR